MHCPKCLKYVPYGAKYCQNCGEAIPDTVRKNAYQKTLWGKLQRLEDWYKTLALKKVTDSIIFKAFILAVILGYGLFNLYLNGTQLKIMDSDMYDVQYNTKLDEYYVLTEADEVVLNLYIPNKASTLHLTGYDAEGAVLEERTIAPADFENPESLAIKRDAYAYLTLEMQQGETAKGQLKCLVTAIP